MKLAAERLRECLASDLLHLILMPTEACNFRCTYCYEDFKYKRMRPEVVRGVKNLLTSRAAELSHLDLAWFGGEPLLARDIIEDVMQHAQALKRANPRLALRSDITTNAWFLTRPVFERLLELGVTRYQISFDGPREHHDLKRVLADGRGTFDRVWKNVRAMRAVSGDFQVLLRIHVDKDNVDAVPRFLDECREAFGGDPRFQVFLRNLARLGGPGDAQLNVLDDREEGDQIRALENYARDHDLDPHDVTRRSAICYASKANSFLVRANGRLNKCTQALEHPANQVGLIHEDGTLEITSQRMLMWMRGLRSAHPIELLCPMIGYADPSALPIDLADSARPVVGLADPARPETGPADRARPATRAASAAG